MGSYNTVHLSQKVFSSNLEDTNEAFGLESVQGIINFYPGNEELNVIDEVPNTIAYETLLASYLSFVSEELGDFVFQSTKSKETASNDAFVWKTGRCDKSDTFIWQAGTLGKERGFIWQAASPKSAKPQECFVWLAASPKSAFFWQAAVKPQSTSSC